MVGEGCVYSGSLVWLGVELGLEPKVLYSPLCKTQVVSASGQATGVGLSQS